MTDEHLPKKRRYLYSEVITTRVEPEIKSDIAFLNGEGYDVPEIIRRSIGEALKKAIDSHNKKSAS